MIFIIRGHIRDTFKTKDLYNFIKKIYLLIPDLKIFIHTWNIFANNLSWRNINVNNETVHQDIIFDYFDDLKHLIKHIIIDDDSKIQLIGNLSGTINKGNAPIIGWKNYWYGKHKIIDFIYNSTSLDKNETVVNTRFDLFNNNHKFSETKMTDLICNNNNKIFTKNIFLFDYEHFYGIDNFYIGNINTMYKLINHFFYNLDDILAKNNNTIHQEFLVFRINSTLFN
jgi:hypothetical protein